MRNVNELNQNELKELRSKLFHELLDDGSLAEIVGDNIEEEGEIPMSFVKDHYRDTLFVVDDFFCNLDNIKLVYMDFYDLVQDETGETVFSTILPEDLQTLLDRKTMDEKIVEETISIFNETNSIEKVDDYLLNALCSQDEREIIVESINDHIEKINLKKDLPTGIYKAKLNSFEIELADGTKINKVNQNIRILVKNVSDFSFVFSK